MFRNKIRNPMIVLLLVAFTGIGGGVALRALADDKPPEQPVARAAPAPAAAAAAAAAAADGLKEQWGLPTAGLQMSITASAKDRHGSPEFAVAIRNVGEQDIAVNLGLMLPNGKA